MKNYYSYVLFTVMGFCLATFFGCSQSHYAKPEDEQAQLLLPFEALPTYEQQLDHTYFLSSLEDKDYKAKAFKNGQKIYGTTCFNCHGNAEQPGSLPNAFRFWADTFKNGNTPYEMYQTLTQGYGLMAPQVQLTPQQKYNVIHYLRENYIREYNPEQYIEITEDYLATLPKGDSLGPEAKEYQPWAEMDYGDFLIYTYEMADKDALPRDISGGPSPLPDENYDSVNFAYKGIAVRLDEGGGGITKGNAWMVFDHDLMRVAGAWTGEAFIDYRAILMNGEHNIYPRTAGNLQFDNPIGPGWAHPKTGSFEDPRFRGLDGRPFGPLPREWAQYQGLYYYENEVIVKYTVGDAEILEKQDIDWENDGPVFVRTLNISPSSTTLFHRISDAEGTIVAMVSEHEQVTMKSEHGYYVMKVPANTEAKVKILVSKHTEIDLGKTGLAQKLPEDLTTYTQGGPAHYPEVLTSPVTIAENDEAYVVDVFHLPKPTPWKSRMMLSGIDFLPGGKEAVVCAVGGDVWKIEDFTGNSRQMKWRRIASGLFQPLGIKYVDGDIYVSCRDQIVRLHDLNGDGDTDFYEAFNSDHQVTEHFHEFAMGLQADEEGNFYYAKSARHARTPLVEQHGTLLRVSADGMRTKILAHGFRAANGVCLNPDGTFIVTDQEGHWNPMNRINWVEPGKFYGNMYGYGAPADSTDEGMEMPLCWVDKKLDRSPSELLWAGPDWGPLSGKLLNFSYGYGKVYEVLHETVNGRRQGGLFELPLPQFASGVMRGRFNPTDGQLYACGLSSWATTRVLQEGALYRIRYTSKPIYLPVAYHVHAGSISLTFSEALNPASAIDTANYQLRMWDLKRTRRYGSDRYNIRKLEVTEAQLGVDGKTVILTVPAIAPTWALEIRYGLEGSRGEPVDGMIQGTVYEVGEDLAIKDNQRSLHAHAGWKTRRTRE